MNDFILFVGEQWILVSVLIALFYVLLFTEKRKSGRLVSSLQVAPLINADDGVILDIRDSADYRSGHIVDAINIPYIKVGERIAELDEYKDKPIIVACKMGQHSGGVGKILLKAGFTQVCRLEGGIEDWRSSSMPLVKS